MKKKERNIVESESDPFFEKLVKVSTPFNLKN